MDFTSVLDTGETVSSASVTVTTYAGSDAAPSALLATVATVVSPIVYQKITGGLEGRTYRIRYQVATSAARTLVAAGYLPVDAP